MKQPDIIRTPNAGLFGSSRRKQKQKRQSGTVGDNRGRAASLRSYCPVCPTIPADPELAPRMVVSERTKNARCVNNHHWIVGGHSLPVGESRLLNI